MSRNLRDVGLSAKSQVGSNEDVVIKENSKQNRMFAARSVNIGQLTLRCQHALVLVA